MFIFKEGVKVSSDPGSLVESTSIFDVLLFVGFTLAIFVAVGSLTWPSSDDHMHYGFVGDTVLAGGVPYQDAWDLKGPLTFYIYGWVRALLGQNELSIRIFDLAVVSLFCWSLRSVVLRLNGNQSSGANFAVLLFLICYFGGGYYWTAQPDDWGAMLILVAVSILLRDTHNPHITMARAGAIIAFAVLLKLTFIIFVPLLLLRTARHRILSHDSIGQFLTGLAVMTAILIVSYMWVFRNGGFQDMVDSLRFISSAYGSITERLSSQRIIHGLGNLYDLGLVIPYVLVPFGLLAMSRSGRVIEARMLGTCFALSITMLVYQGVYYLYEYISATLSAIVIIGASLGYIGRWIKTPIARYAGEGAIFLTIGTICLAPHVSSTLFGAFGWPGYALGLRTANDYVVQISHPADRRYAMQELSAYLVGHTSPDDKVQIWGWVSGFGALALSNRRTASRFADTWPVIANTPMQKHYRSVFIQEVSKSRPRNIIVDVSAPWAEPVREFPELDLLIRSHYQLVDHVAGYQIWALEQHHG